MFINLEMYIITQVSLIGQSKLELTDVDFSFHWLFENIATDQGLTYCKFGNIIIRKNLIFANMHKFAVLGIRSSKK